MVTAIAALVLCSPGVDLAQLGRQYRAYELPMLPLGSKPVWLALPPKIQPADPSMGLFAWHIPGREAGQYFAVLQQYDLSALVERPIPGEPQALMEGHGETACTVAQLELLGYRDLATRLLSEESSPRTDLQSLAFSYWSNIAWTQPEQRNKILHLLTRFPTLDGIALTKTQNAFLSDLRLTMKPDRPTTSVDRDLDKLLFAKGELTDMCWLPLVDPEPVQKKLWLEGFDAVPALLRHIEDRRLTTMHDGSDCIGPIWGYSQCVTLGDQVIEMLELLSGETFDTGNSDGASVRTRAEAWWNRVKHSSEKQYLERQLTRAKGDFHLSVNAKYWAAIYEAKYSYP